MRGRWSLTGGSEAWRRIGAALKPEEGEESGQLYARMSLYTVGLCQFDRHL